jgi:hypothetical protein
VEDFTLNYNHFIPQIHYSYANALDHLNFHILWTKGCHLGVLFLINVYNGFKFCPSLIETVTIHIPTQNFTDAPLFTVGSAHKTCWFCDCYHITTWTCRTLR